MSKNPTPRAARRAQNWSRRLATAAAGVIAVTSLTALTAVVAPPASAATPSITNPASGPYRTGQPLTISGYDPAAYNFLQLFQGAGCTGGSIGYYLLRDGEAANGTFTVTVPPVLNGPINGEATGIWYRETSFVLEPHLSGRYLKLQSGAATACVGPLSAALLEAPVVTIDNASPKIGDTLKAMASAQPSPNLVTYTWFADGVRVSETDTALATYLVKPADAGKAITAQAVLRRSGYGNATVISSPVSVEAAPTSPVTIAANSTSKVFGDQDPALTFTTTGLLNGDSLTTPPTCTREAGENVGSRTITCSGAEAGDAYEITYETGELSIGKRLVTVTPTGRSITYGDALPATYPFTVTSGSLVGDDALTGSCGVAGTPSAAGQYPITCDVSAGPNYDVRVAEAFLTIAKKDGVVVPDPQTITFGETDPEFTYSVSGLLPGDELDTEPTCGVAGSHSDAGTYTITCSGGADENYTVNQTATATLTVKKAPFTVTANNKSRVYGATDPVFDATVTGIDAITVDPTCAVEQPYGDVGEYTITCSGASAGPNYEATYVDAAFTITKKSVAVTPAPTSTSFGVAVPTPAPSYDGFANGETAASVFSGAGAFAPTCSANTAAGSDAGVYVNRSTCTGGVARNYSFDTSARGTVTISQAPVRVTTAASSTLVSIFQGFRYTFTTTVTNAAPGAGNAPAAGVPVTITVPGSTVTCRGTTDAHGVAICKTNPLFLAVGRLPYKATTGASTNFVAGASGSGVITTL